MSIIFRILATVLIAISVLTGIIKNIIIFADKESSKDVNAKALVCWSLWSICWRAFVITAIWLIR